MKDKYSNMTFRGRTLALVALFSLLVNYSDAVFAWSLDDPLYAEPEIIHSGKALPGDDSVAPCPVKKNFAEPLLLSEAVDITLCNNTQIKVAWANIKIQASALGQTRAAYLPTVTGSVSRIKDKTTYPDISTADTNITDNLVTGTLTWRLYDFGGRQANRQAAAALLSAALESQDSTIQKSLSAVIQAYFDAFTARATVAARHKDVDISQKIFNSAKSRSKKGAADNGDIFQAVTALAKAKLEMNRATGEYQKTLSVLVYTLGIPGDTNIILPDDINAAEKVDPQELRSWLKLAEKTHPEIQAARSQLNAAEYKVNAKKAERYPTIDFNVNYYQNGRPGQSLLPVTSHETTVGVTLTIPIFSGFSDTYKIRDAESQVEEKQAQLEDTEHQVAMNIVKAYADAESAMHNLKASEDLLTAAQNSLTVFQHKYSRGAADIIELLNAQSALVDAQQQRIKSLDDWRSSRLRLLASAGQLGHAALNH